LGRNSKNEYGALDIEKNRRSYRKKEGLKNIQR